ncbi:peroxidase-like protein 3 [Haliotis cracherodii]|uniref:peroxidase-like protein 3 n=1 Tax=Haliotis cracherodii TaxID=6455 RepID=UPI0039E80D59
MHEAPVSGGVVGPTIAYILGQQYSDIRSGDRFWHETTNTTLGFTTSQLSEINQITLARVICTNTGITSIQPDAFSIPDATSNAEVSCSSLGDINFSEF